MTISYPRRTVEIRVSQVIAGGETRGSADTSYAAAWRWSHRMDNLVAPSTTLRKTRTGVSVFQRRVPRNRRALHKGLSESFAVRVGELLGDDALEVGVDHGSVKHRPSPTPLVSALQPSARLAIWASLALRCLSGRADLRRRQSAGRRPHTSDDDAQTEAR